MKDLVCQTKALGLCRANHQGPDQHGDQGNDEQFSIRRRRQQQCDDVSTRAEKTAWADNPGAR